MMPTSSLALTPGSVGSPAHSLGSRAEASSGLGPCACLAVVLLKAVPAEMLGPEGHFKPSCPQPGGEGQENPCVPNQDSQQPRRLRRLCVCVGEGMSGWEVSRPDSQPLVKN